MSKEKTLNESKEVQMANDKGVVSSNLLSASFEVGKYYRHPGGGCMHIIGAAKTTLYGWALIAEEHKSTNLKPVGVGSGNSDNWTETSEEDWMSGFSR